jgi:chromosomal replication initiation ATPase DnaA
VEAKLEDANVTCRRCPLCGSRARVSRLSAGPIDARSNLGRIIQAVANEYSISADVILGESKLRKYAEARKVVYWIALESGWQPTRLAAQLLRHHTTVINGARRIAYRMQTKPMFGAVVNRILGSILEAA